MQIYTAIISKNITPYSEGDPFLNDHIRVRIPDFHGPKSEEAYINNLPNGAVKTCNITDDKDLPWALVNRGFDDNTWSAQSFNEGDLVYVILQNQDAKSPVIMGFASRFSYTEDIATARDNYLYKTPEYKSFGGASDSSIEFSNVYGSSSIIAVAQNEVGYIAKRSNSDLTSKKANPYCGGSKHTKYMQFACGSSAGEWCVAFCCWVFNQAGYGNYFCNGQKMIGVRPVLQHYNSKSPNSVVKFSNWKSLKAKAGDLVIFDWDNSGDGDHIGLVAQDQGANDNFIVTIEGNTKLDSDGSKSAVDQKKRSYNVLYLIRTGIPVIKQGGLVNASDNESKVWNAIASTIRLGENKDKQLNNAAICGILGNLSVETSGFNPTASCIDTNGKESYGLIQWNGGRYSNLKSWCKEQKLDYKTIEAQIAFLNHELNSSSYSHVATKLLAIPNTKEGSREAALLFAEKFEVCASSSWEKRASNAESIYWPKYHNLQLGMLELEPYKTFKANDKDIPNGNNIVMIADKSTNKLDVYKRNGSKYTKVQSINAAFDKNKTKPGLYNIGVSFGLAADPGAGYHYLSYIHEDRTFKDDLCTDWYNIKTNKFETFLPDGANKSDYIHLSDFSGAYNYGLVIMGETSSKNVNVGSGLFIHCGKKSVNGGIAISESDIKKLFTNLKGFTPKLFNGNSNDIQILII